MKKFIKILIILTTFHCFTFKANAQKVYKFKNGTLIKQCDVNGDTSTNTKPDPIESGWLFHVEKRIGNRVIIYFVQWKSKNNKISQYFIDNDKKNTLLENRNQKYVRANDGNRIYYQIYSAQFDILCEEAEIVPRLSPTLGTVLMPLKVRFGSSKNTDGSRDRYFDFTSDVSLGLCGGLKISLKRSPIYKINVLVGISGTSIPIDSLSTKGLVKTKTNIAALTPSFHIVFEIKEFQMGFSLGCDLLSSRIGDNWAYNGKPWVGFGIGYNLLSKPSTNQTKQSD